MMDNEADRENALRGSILPPGHEQYDYDGEFNAQPVPQIVNVTAQYDALTAAIVQQGFMTLQTGFQISQAVNGVLSEAQVV